MARQIVLFGGTFDPVHHGHLIVARCVAELCLFDRITFLPAASPPHKARAAASADHRLRMLQLAVEGDEMFDVCDVELRREGPSYTFDTIEAIRAVEGPDVDIRLVIGADMLEDLPNWREASKLVDAAGWVIAARPPWDSRMDEIIAHCRDRLSPAQAKRLGESVLVTPLLEISSTDIRRRTGRGLSTRYLVPEAVRRYIEEHGLYASSAGETDD